ncbi:MAG: restriction endonuclease subunit S, partial [Spirochaetaceae bacterium]|nr:restriction endonuclease subunit S [Spirochaetaceae bacterium]
MTQWKKVKIGDVCKIVKGTTGIASAEPGEYPLVVTAEERKTCSTYQFDCEAVCIPLVSSSGHGKKSLNNVHYQSGKFALGTILCAVIPNNSDELDARFLHQYLQFYKDIVLVPLMKGAANVSLSMKDIATVEFPMPPIERQKELSNLFVLLQEKQKELSAEFEKQSEYAKLLRQNILQDAIEGKLTADLPCRQAGWRKSHFKNLSGKIVPKTSDKYFAYVLECDDGCLYKGFSQN